MELLRVAREARGIAQDLYWLGSAAHAVAQQYWAPPAKEQPEVELVSCFKEPALQHEPEPWEDKAGPSRDGWIVVFN